MAVQTRLTRELRLEHRLMLVRMAVLAVSPLLAGKQELLASLRRLRRQHDIFGRLVALDTFLLKFLVSSRNLEVR